MKTVTHTTHILMVSRSLILPDKPYIVERRIDGMWRLMSHHRSYEAAVRAARELQGIRSTLYLGKKLTQELAK